MISSACLALSFVHNWACIVKAILQDTVRLRIGVKLASKFTLRMSVEFVLMGSTCGIFTLTWKNGFADQSINYFLNFLLFSICSILISCSY